MSEVKTQQDQAQHTPEPAVALSAEERAVLTRVREQAGKGRSSRLRRFLKDPPLFFWWWAW